MFMRFFAYDNWSIDTKNDICYNHIVTNCNNFVTNKNIKDIKMKHNNIKVTAVVLTLVMALGSSTGVLAETPVAGVSNYNATGSSSGSLPNAGFSANMMEIALNCEVNAKIAANNPQIEANEYNMATSEYTDMAVANVSEWVYIRVEPNEESDYVGKLYANCVCTLIDEVDGWYQIQSGTCSGYVKAEYLIVHDTDAVRAASRRVATVSVDGLRIRSAATTDATVLGRVGAGDDLTVVDENSIEGWVKVSIEEGDGFVAAEYVTLSTEFSFAESKEEEQARLAAEAAAKKKAEEAAKRRAAEKKKSSGKTYSAPAGSNGSAVANYAVQFVGNPYRYGGYSLTNGTDCSGFVMSVYAQFGIGLPHSSSSLRSCGARVDGGLANAQPGDVICYSGHVGIYIGNGQIVHASNRRDGIKISPATYRSILAIRRIV